jgi:excisionase family DNA binding protein
MKRSRRNDFVTEIPVKMKVIEILETRAESLSVKDVVGLLGLSKSLIYGMIATGELPATRYHSRIKLDPNHVIEWVKRRTWQPVRAMPPMRDKAAPGLASGLERAG